MPSLPALMVCSSLLLATGCALVPDTYKIDMRQGNFFDEEMVARLRPGMDKRQVQHVMGTPLIHDPFHQNRWDYLYSTEPGGGQRRQRHVVLHFDGDLLARIDGDAQDQPMP